jgi:hypothetical protein
MSPFGTFRTWRDVRHESVLRLKADIGQPRWTRLARGGTVVVLDVIDAAEKHA